MIARTVAALAAAALAGMSAIAASAQEPPRGHESARGPSAAPMQAPREGGPGAAAAPGHGRAGQGPAPRAPAPTPAPAPMPAPAHGPTPTPRAGPGPGRSAPADHGPRAPGFGQRPMGQAQAPSAAPAPAQRHFNGPSPRPEYGHRPMGQTPAAGMQPHGPGGTPQFDRRPHVAPRAPIAQAPRAYGAVPAPYRGDIHRFVDLDARVWRGGRWHHRRHDGRLGWWWVVGGLWYFYPQPVYPYPDPFAPGEVIDEEGSANGYWYYCESAGQYYPYVTTCPEGWIAVVPDE